MAFFSRTTNKEAVAKPVDVAAVTAPAVKVVGITHSFTHVLRSPRITEKASRAMEGSVYVFDVAPDANKKQITSAIQAVYKVKPHKVAIVNTKPKSVRNMRTGKSGMKGGFKKAYVYLKKGETITIA
ncbi:MAG: 50S ribosomal protein L23 [Patescibacteria group bacterium]